jgi:pimeloyl-ACP methyl ester carboxylesterase
MLSTVNNRVVVGLVAVAAAVILLGVVGWRQFGEPPTYDPNMPLSEQCDDVPAGAKRVTLPRVDGMTLGAALVGPADARVGVVLRQGAGQTICEWLPWAADVAEATGARVLLFDRRGQGSSPGEEDLSEEPADLASAVALLRKRGASDVAVVGSSMGNSVTFDALDRLPPPCALVAISPVLLASDSHGVLDGTGMTPLPDNIWVTWEQQNRDIVANVDLIRSRADEQGVPPPQLLPVDTDDHSIGLVQRHDEVQDFVFDAIDSC